MSSKSDTSAGVSKCYVFKSQLQEYAQKAGLLSPVYQTIKEGPSHEPLFRSTVIVKNVKYDSLPGFYNRKAAEQSAAEVALMELARSGELNQTIAQPVQETGLCKNLLQEYAQKMNYAIPLYKCTGEEKSGREILFSCTVELGGIRYIGAAAKTKKEAEIKAARTALIAIKSSSEELNQNHNSMGNSQLTVLPCKKNGTESGLESTPTVLKPKKSRFKKRKYKYREKKARLEAKSNGQDGHEPLVQTEEFMAIARTGNFQEVNMESNGEQIVDGDLIPHFDENPISEEWKGVLKFDQNGVTEQNGQVGSEPEQSKIYSVQVETDYLQNGGCLVMEEANMISGNNLSVSDFNQSSHGSLVEEANKISGEKQMEDASYIEDNQSGSVLEQNKIFSFLEETVSLQDGRCLVTEEANMISGNNLPVSDFNQSIHGSLVEAAKNISGEKQMEDASYMGNRDGQVGSEPEQSKISSVQVETEYLQDGGCLVLGEANMISGNNLQVSDFNQSNRGSLVEAANKISGEKQMEDASYMGNQDGQAGSKLEQSKVFSVQVETEHLPDEGCLFWEEANTTPAPEFKHGSLMEAANTNSGGKQMEDVSYMDSNRG